MNKYALICEDNLTSAYCIKGILEKFGYNAEIAQDAETTLKLLNKNKYDLLTLDLLLPDMNGIEIAKEIENIEFAKNLPIIVISAVKQEDVKFDFPNNIVFWLEKSSDVKSLESAIETVLKQNSKRKMEIFHVENDEDLLNLIEITLSDIANVTKSDNLSEAKKILEKQKFDLIILDYVFPEGTSDKLIPTIK